MTGQYQPGKGFVQPTNARTAIAQALMAQGSSTSPVRSPLEGIARALTGGVGGYIASMARDDSQKALKAAMAALQDPSIPADQRLMRAADIAGADSPEMAGRFLEMAMQQTLNPKLEKYGQGDRGFVRQPDGTYKETIKAAADLPQGFRINEQTGQAEAIPGFMPAVSGLEQAKADVRLAMEPQIKSAETRATRQATNAVPLTTEQPGFQAQVARARTEAERRGQLAVPLPPTGYQPGPNGVSPIPGGPQDPDVIRTTEKAKQEGQNAGKGSGPTNDNERKWRQEFEKPLTQMVELVKQRDRVKVSLEKKDGTGDIAAIIGFNKLLDEGAIVREQDISLTLAAQGLKDRLAIWMANKQEGDILPQELRRKIGDLTEQIFSVSSSATKARVMPYRPVIESEGAAFNNVVPLELQTKLGWAAPAPSASKPADSPQGLPQLKNDPASRAAYDKLVPGSAYYDYTVTPPKLKYKP
jgi:hypothetical protein